MKPRFAESKDAKKAGWFSKRHRSDDANREARERHRAERSKQARRDRAYARGAPRPGEEKRNG